MTPDHDLKRSGFLLSAPEAVGIPSHAISGFLQALKEHPYCLHAFLLMRNGRLCFSTAAAPYTLDTPHRVFSTGKSILALSLYFAMQEGYLTLEDRIAPYFRDLLGDDTRFDTMTVCDLLTMRSGQVEDAFPVILTDIDADLIRLFFQAPPVEAPGQTFRYNNTIPHIVYALVERATGIPFEQYQKSHLCDPLHAPVYAPTNSSGQYNPVVMAMSANTLLTFAQFYLQEGVWEGQTLLKDSYIRDAVKLHTPTGQSGNSAEYSFQIWRNAFGGYRMDGGWGQFAIVLPQENLAAVILSDMPDPAFALKAFETELLPHLSKTALPMDTASFQMLLTQGESLTLAPEGGKPVSAQEAEYSSEPYHFADAGMVMRFSMAEESIGIEVEQGGQRETFHCGLRGKWLENPAHLLVTPQRNIDNGVYCLPKDTCLLSGTWQTDQVLEVISKSLGALGLYQYRFTFSKRAVTLEYTPIVCRGNDSLQKVACVRAEGRQAADERSRT